MEDKIELELTPKVQQWLDTPESERDIAAGAELLLRINRNKILHRNIMRNPERKKDVLEYHLQKILKERLVEKTHSEVQRMMVKVDAIVKAHALDRTENEARSAWQKGKRADHDELPPEVQHLWEENGDLIRKMRDAHTKLRLINESNSSCPDNDRYPIAQYLIECDIRYRDNWNLYDHYVKGTKLSETKMAVDPRSASKNAVKTVNMLLGRYAKNRDPKLADRIRGVYAKIELPSAKLIEKMKEADLT